MSNESTSPEEFAEVYVGTPTMLHVLIRAGDAAWQHEIRIPAGSTVRLAGAGVHHFVAQLKADESFPKAQ